MKIKVIKTSGRDWYANCIGCVYEVEREAMYYYIVRRYGIWEHIDKEHAEVVQ